MRRKTPPFGILHILAERSMRRESFVRPSAQRLIDDVADAIFSGRQDFIVELRKFAGDLEFQLICRRVLVALRRDEFLANALFDFLVELRVNSSSVRSPSAIEAVPPFRQGVAQRRDWRSPPALR